MLDERDYTGYTVIVKKVDTKETLEQTEILECHRRQHSIFIRSSQLAEGYGDKLNLLILGGDFIHEFFGIARKTSVPNRAEITLFKGKEKEDRTAKRYDLNAEANISDIKYAEVQEPKANAAQQTATKADDACEIATEANAPEPNVSESTDVEPTAPAGETPSVPTKEEISRKAPQGEIKVKLVNLSSIGVLIETEEDILEMDATFKLKLDIAGKLTVILCKVLRVDSMEDETVQCGCKFISVKTE